MPRTQTLEASRRRRDDARAWGFSHQKRAALLPKNSRGAREGGGTRRASAGRETAIGSVARCRYRSDPLAEAPHTAANGRAAGQWPPRSPERADRRCERGTVEIFMRRVPRIIHETSATSTHPSRKRRASGHPRFQPRTHFLIDQITHQKITRKWRWKDRSVGRSVGSFFEKSFSHASRPSRYWEDQTRVRREDRVALRRDPILLLQSLDELRLRGSRFTVVPYQSSSILFPGDGAW